jgi:hypothetical protein
VDPQGAKDVLSPEGVHEGLGVCVEGITLAVKGSMESAALRSAARKSGGRGGLVQATDVDERVPLVCVTWVGGSGGAREVRVWSLDPHVPPMCFLNLIS